MNIWIYLDLAVNDMMRYSFSFKCVNVLVVKQYFILIISGPLLGSV